MQMNKWIGLLERVVNGDSGPGVDIFFAQDL
jgi:hypothetical protein